MDLIDIYNKTGTLCYIYIVSYPWRNRKIIKADNGELLRGIDFICINKSKGISEIIDY